jgi:hypothetical protein
VEDRYHQSFRCGGKSAVPLRKVVGCYDWVAVLVLNALVGLRRRHPSCPYILYRYCSSRLSSVGQQQQQHHQRRRRVHQYNSRGLFSCTSIVQFLPMILSITALLLTYLSTQSCDFIHQKLKQVDYSHRFDVGADYQTVQRQLFNLIARKKEGLLLPIVHNKDPLRTSFIYHRESYGFPSHCPVQPTYYQYRLPPAILLQQSSSSLKTKSTTGYNNKNNNVTTTTITNDNNSYQYYEENPFLDIPVYDFHEPHKLFNRGLARAMKALRFTFVTTIIILFLTWNQQQQISTTNVLSTTTTAAVLPTTASIIRRRKQGRLECVTMIISIILLLLNTYTTIVATDANVSSVRTILKNEYFCPPTTRPQCASSFYTNHNKNISNHNHNIGTTDHTIENDPSQQLIVDACMDGCGWGWGAIQAIIAAVLNAFCAIVSFLVFGTALHQRRQHEQRKRMGLLDASSNSNSSNGTKTADDTDDTVF